MVWKKLAHTREKSVEELEEEIAMLKAELSKERAAISSGTRAEKPSKIRDTRRKIARLLTIIGEKKKTANQKGGATGNA